MNESIKDKVNRARRMIAALPISQLVESFELTSGRHGEEIPTVRGWLLDELEKRDPAAFETWMLDDDPQVADSPRNYFLA
jgi:hypothetical protein